MTVRDTSLRLFFGKIRSLVKKITGEYTVTTPTSSIGVRGTDFVVAVAPLRTAVLTGRNQSAVELAGRYGPSIMANALSAAGVRQGSPATPAVYLGTLASELLRQIAPTEEEVPHQAVHNRCWNFSVKIPANGSGLAKKEILRACLPMQK
jgi:hypothetical protein